TIDGTGVGQLVEIAVQKGRKTRKDLKLGICGEHGGDPDSIKFFEKVGLDYVSASPFRVPVARLAAAQAATAGKKWGGGAGGAAVLSVMNTIFVHRDGRTEQVTSID